jgi:hypothetical protein
MIRITNPLSLWIIGAATLLMVAASVSACGSGPTLARPTGALGPSLMMAPPSAAPATSPELFPLTFGATRRYTNVSPNGGGETRTETITQLLERPNPIDGGTVTIAEIQRTETGKPTFKYTVERYPKGMFRSYDPTLLKLGAPILCALSDKPQEWGYNPGNGYSGYLQILQLPGATEETIGSQVYAGCVKVRMTTSGQGFPAFQRETTWAPGIGPVRIVEGTASRHMRIFELTKPGNF